MCRDDRMGRALVVDKSEEVRHALHYALDSYGYEVLSCVSGNEAIELLAGAAFDYIILDHDPPDMTGVELTRAARRLAPSLTVIIGLSDAGPADDLLRAGANDVRQKPFVPYEIAMMIDGADLADTEPAYKHVNG